MLQTDDPSRRERIKTILTLAVHSEMDGAITIRPTRPSDETAWRALWAAYACFSNVEMPASVTDATWRRIVEPDSPMKALLATDAAGDAMAFAVFVLHPYTFGEGLACLVDDMYVRPEVRRLGIGKAVLTRLASLAASEGWSKVYWVADENNSAARRMFDREFGPADGYVRYTVARNGVHCRTHQALVGGEQYAACVECVP